MQARINAFMDSDSPESLAPLAAQFYTDMEQELAGRIFDSTDLQPLPNSLWLLGCRQICLPSRNAQQSRSTLRPKV
jgi:hypothetical protein